MYRLIPKTTLIFPLALMWVMGRPVHPVAASQDTVHFDTSQTAAAAAIFDIDFSRAHPDERLVAVRLIISASVAATHSDAIGELRYDIYAPEQRLSVFDFEPKTTHSTDVVGNIQIQDSKSEGKRIQLSIDGAASQFLRADANGGRDASQSTSKHYEVRPPREVVFAAGTVQRGHGVYFKLLPSEQASVEGAREFSLVFRVPYDWRGDYLRAACVATGRRGQTLGKSSFFIPIFDQNDASAKRLAKRVSQKEQQLIATAFQLRDDVRRARYPTVAHELSLAKPKIPAHWLTMILSSKAGAPPLSFERALPSSVVNAITEYRRALDSLTNLPPLASEMMANVVTSQSASRWRHARDDAITKGQATTVLKPLSIEPRRIRRDDDLRLEGT